MLKQLSQDLNTLQEWFKINPKVPAEIDRRLLLRFLKCMSGDIEATKKLIELNYELRNKNPQIFLDRDPADVGTLQVLARIDSIALPGLTPEGYKVIINRMIDFDASKVNSIEELKMFHMLGDCRFVMPDTEAKDDVLNIEEEEQAVGEVHISDITGYSMGHMVRSSLSAMRIHLKYLQEAYPLRMKAMHVINCPSMIDTLVAFVRPFINDEVFKLLHFHTSGLDSLYEQVPREMLPIEYGGSAGTMEELKAKWKKILHDKRSYLKDPNQWKVQKE